MKPTLRPAGLVVAVAAPLLLRLFGDEYARRGATLLSLLALGAIPNMINVLTLNLARVQHDYRVMLAIRLSLGIGCLVLDYVLLAVMGDIVGVGLAVLAVQCVVALAALPYLLRIRTRWKTAQATAA